MESVLTSDSFRIKGQNQNKVCVLYLSIHSRPTAKNTRLIIAINYVLYLIFLAADADPEPQTSSDQFSVSATPDGKFLTSFHLPE